MLRICRSPTASPLGYLKMIPPNLKENQDYLNASIGKDRYAGRPRIFACEVGPMSIFSKAVAGLARPSSLQHRFVFLKKLNASRLVRPLCAAIALGASLVSAGAQTAPPASLQQRLQAIFDMSAEDMAATSAFTKRAYEAQLAHIYRIQNKQIRDIVLEFVLNPKATAFEQAATQSWLASPGSGWKSHHAYPGGLSIHNLEWVEVASAWVDTYEKVYGVKLDRDLVIAGLILHDWGKLWFLFDDGSGKIQEPEWYPKAWGTKAKWKWRGGCGEFVRVGLIHRGAPKELLFAAASAHFDPHWGLETDGEGLNPAMSEAAAIARKPVPLVNPEQRLAEWWIVTFTDEAWSFSTVAAKFAFEVIEGVTKDLGLKSDSREANKVAWFVLSRVGDFKIYEVYQKA